MRRLPQILLSVALTAIVLQVPIAAQAGPAPGGDGVNASEDYVATQGGPGRFPLVEHGVAAPIVVSASDFAGVIRVADDLQSDIAKVTGVTPGVTHDTIPNRRDIVLIGTIGTSTLIDTLIADRKLDVRDIRGKWETTVETIVNDPLPGVRRAFVIAGSDQRGTIYGAYDVSKRIGVSPWYWWDDVPAAHHDALYLRPGRHSQGTPAVKYRGFFINDENPATGTWAPEFFGPGKAPGYPGGLNAAYYAKIFETMLRLKANYLWPAVWGRAFAEDDPQNHATATFYGVVMGTSHEAPMMRGIEEWNRHAVNGTDPYGGDGEWSFRRNADALKAYWRDGIERMKAQNIEGVVTLGMRGNGDVSLPDGDGIDLMSSIIESQRQILADEGMLGVPQVQTLYKEVQRYWDKGYRPPDDVTVVFCDDNWGNMRRLPTSDLPKRGGGYGMYYHFDYVGGGRNYKWVDTVNLTNTWEQLHLTYNAGVDRLWMFNVGDMKNQEAPLQFALDYAWAPDKLPVSRIGDWFRRYAAENFGGALAGPIADVLATYSQLQSRRKPELLNRHISLDPTKDVSSDSSAVVYDDQGNPFSLTDYREMDRVTAEWQALAAKADRVRAALPRTYQDAFYELVYYEVKATANLYRFRNAEFTNILYAQQGRAIANDYAAEAEARFAEDQSLANSYNTTLAGGKWHDWQLQPHIDYGDVARYGPNAPWQQPELNNVALPDVIFPAVRRISPPTAAEMGVAIDGSTQTWPGSTAVAVLPAFSPFQSQPAQYIDVFNRGLTAFPYSISAGQPWVHVSPSAGRVDKQVRATVRVDWSRAPKGTTQVPITITGANGATVVVQAPIQNPVLRYGSGSAKGFVEANGYVSIEASHYSKAVGTRSAAWQVLPGIGKTGDGVAAVAPDTVSYTPGGNSPHLEYTMTLTSSGPVEISAILSPRNNVRPTAGLRYAISIDDAAPQIVNVTKATGADDTTMNRQWERNTSNNANVTVTTHVVGAPGVHTLKFWMVDPTVIVQKLIVDTGGLAESYLGPPESRRS
jgi:hypothetical protein